MYTAKQKEVKYSCHFSQAVRMLSLASSVFHSSVLFPLLHVHAAPGRPILYLYDHRFFPWFHLEIDFNPSGRRTILGGITMKFQMPFGGIMNWADSTENSGSNFEDGNALCRTIVMSRTLYPRLKNLVPK